jgi:hypothetical protein
MIYGEKFAILTAKAVSEGNKAKINRGSAE